MDACYQKYLKSTKRITYEQLLLESYKSCSSEGSQKCSYESNSKNGHEKLRKFTQINYSWEKTWRLKETDIINGEACWKK